MRAVALPLFLSLSLALPSHIQHPFQPSSDRLPDITLIGDDFLSAPLFASAPGSPVSCIECRSALFSLKTALSISPSTAFSLAHSFCIRYTSQDNDVCAGVIAHYGPALIEVLPSVEPWGYSGHLACATVVNSCVYPQPQGTVELEFPSEREHPQLPPGEDDGEEEPLLVVHISDWHYDPLYLAGSEADCSKPMCCRAYNDSSPSSGVAAHPASSWGEYLCDAPLKLGESLLRSVEKRLGRSPDWVVFSGDVPPHDVWATTEKGTLLAINTSYALFHSHLRAPVYPTVGNHESSPSNLFQPRELVKVPANQWVFDGLAESWAGWLGEETTEYVRRERGRYSVRVREGLRVISLNTNDCYTQNLYLFSNTSLLDPNSQLLWLAHELDAAEQAGEKVWIVSHIAPGDGTCLRSWSDAFDRIVKRYWKVIGGVFSGHTHKDEFKVWYSDDEQRVPANAIAVNYITPSVTPYTEVNPGWRVYAVHPRTFDVLDSWTYVADLEQATEWDRDGAEPVWELEYSARDYLPSWPKAAPLNATFWAEVAESLEKDDATFERYYLRRFKGGPGARSGCEGECRERIVGGVRAGNGALGVQGGVGLGGIWGLGSG